MRNQLILNDQFAELAGVINGPGPTCPVIRRGICPSVDARRAIRSTANNSREGGRGFRTSSSVGEKVFNAIVKERTNLDGFEENEGCFKIVIEKRMKFERFHF